MRPGAVILVVLLIVGVGVGAWFLAKRQCGSCPTCPTPDPCPSCPTPDPCPTCPTPDPCPTCPTCPTCPDPKPCPDCPTCPDPKPCPDCPSCPGVNCDKDCPYTAPENLVIDLTSTPPTADFLGISMEYTGESPDWSGQGVSAIFTHRGLPTLQVFDTGGSFAIIQVNAYYDPSKPYILAQITTQGQPGTYTDTRVLPVSVTVGKY